MWYQTPKSNDDDDDDDGCTFFFKMPPARAVLVFVLFASFFLFVCLAFMLGMCVQLEWC